MNTQSFTVILLVVAAVVIVAVLSNRLSARIRVPAPALFLIVSAAAAGVFPDLSLIPRGVDEEIVTVALIFILFDGGTRIGWRRFRRSAAVITWLGVLGTALTAAVVAVAAHFVFGFEWQMALLLGAALSPTDPAVVFSILGKREIEGRTGTILEGESGANDPVGIALMVSLLAATGTGWSQVGSGIGQFLVQLSVGAAVGLAGGWSLAKLVRHVSLPNEALYPVRTIACAALIYAVASLLHGSGFLAVLLAGIIVGDGRAPFKREVAHFTAGIATLAEIVVFTLLGLSADLRDVLQPATLGAGLAIAAILIFLIRPVLIGPMLLPARLRPGERGFILWAGLKGAVPILLGMYVLSADVPGASTVYAIIFIVVLTSVLLQGMLVTPVASWLRVPMRTVEPEPWAAGIRFQAEPEGLARHIIAPGAIADGKTVADLDLGETGWISMISRRGRLVQVRGTTRLHAGDLILTLEMPETQLAHLFDGRQQASGSADLGDG